MTVDTLLAASPKNTAEFYAHIRQCINVLSPLMEKYDDRGLKKSVAKICRNAKYKAIELGLSPTAGVGQGDAYTPADGILYLQSLLPQPESAAVESPFLDAKGAAKYLLVSIKQLYTIVERGQLKPNRGPKNTYRFRRDQLDAYCEARKSNGAVSLDKKSGNQKKKGR